MQPSKMDSHQVPRTGSIFLRGTRLCLRLPCPEESFHSLQYLLQTALIAFGHVRIAQHLDEQFELYSTQITLTFHQIRRDQGDKILSQIFWLWLHSCLKAEKEWKEKAKFWQDDFEIKEDLIALGYSISFCFDAIKVLSSDTSLPTYSKVDNLPNYCGCSAHSSLVRAESPSEHSSFSGSDDINEVLMKVPVVPSQQGGQTTSETVAEVNECPSYSSTTYSASLATLSPDHFIPGVPLEFSGTSMERERSPFCLYPPNISSDTTALQPPTEKEKEILFRMHQELVYADLEPWEPEDEIQPEQILVSNNSNQSTSAAAMNKSRTRSAPSFIYTPSSSSSSSSSRTSTSDPTSNSISSPIFNESSTYDESVSSLDWASDQELLFETRRRRDNYLQARMRLAEQVTTRYKRFGPNTLRRMKSSDSLRSVDSREGILPTKVYAYGKGGLRDVRTSPFSPSRLPNNQSLQNCSTPISNSLNQGYGSKEDERFGSNQDFQNWLNLPSPQNFDFHHGLERPDWILTEPFSQSLTASSSPSNGISAPTLNLNM